MTMNNKKAIAARHHRPVKGVAQIADNDDQKPASPTAQREGGERKPDHAGTKHDQGPMRGR